MFIDLSHFMPRSERSALGWSIDVQQTTRRALVEHFTHPDRIHILSTEQQVLQRLESVRDLTRELIEKRRCEEQCRNFLFRELRCKVARRKTHMTADDHQLRAVQQRAPDFKGRRIE